MKTVNDVQVLAAIRRSVKRRGKMWRGASGQYFGIGNEPACLLGDVIYHEWGVTRKDLGEYGNTTWVSALRNRLREKGIDFTPEAVEILRIAQNQNDRGVRWGAIFRESVQQSKRLVKK